MLIWGGEVLAELTGQDALATIWFLLPIIIVPSMVLVLLVRPDPKTIAQNLEQYYPGYVAPRVGRWRRRRRAAGSAPGCATSRWRRRSPTASRRSA